MEKFANKKIWFLLSAATTVVGYLLFILFGHRYNYDFIRVISFLMILVFPGYMQSSYFEFKSNKWYEKLVNVFISLLWLLPLFYGITWSKNKYNEIQLEKYPKIAFAKVVDYETTHGKSGTNYYAVFEYEVNGEHFQQNIENNDSFWKIEDSLKLLVSEKDPEIFKILGYKR